MKPAFYIKEAFLKGKLHHSILVEGEGIETATFLAKILNCSSEDPPCGKCRNCKAIEAGLHPDFISILPSRSIKIGQIREIIELSIVEPFAGKYRVIFIREAEKMTPEAANAFLKILEEPPSSTYFILATENPASLPATILSRCLHLKEEEKEGESDEPEFFADRESLQTILNSVASREELKEIVSSAINYLGKWFYKKASGNMAGSDEWKEEEVLQVLESLWSLRFALEQPLNLSIAKDFFRSCMEKLLPF